MRNPLTLPCVFKWHGLGQEINALIWRQPVRTYWPFGLWASQHFLALVCFLIGKMEMKVPPFKGCCED